MSKKLRLNFFDRVKVFTLIISKIRNFPRYTLWSVYNYKVTDIELPTNIGKRLEALGMTCGTPVTVLNSKNHGVLIVKVRGTRFALGRNITKKVLVG